MTQYRVLSTKKLHPSLHTAATERGIAIREEEFIAIQPIQTPDKHDEIVQWVLYPGELYVVFTSQHAVDFTAPHFHHDDTYYVTTQWRVFCMQGTTATAVKKYLKEEQIIATASNAAELAAVIAADSTVKQVVFFCGNLRREELPSQLRAKGIEVKEVVVYETTPAPVITDAAIDAVLFFSPSAVHSFFSVNTLSSTTTCFAIGPTTASAIAEHTANRIITAGDPSQETMMASLWFYLQNINQYE